MAVSAKFWRYINPFGAVNLFRDALNNGRAYQPTQADTSEFIGNYAPQAQGIVDRYDNMAFSPSTLQKIAEWFGDFSARDAFDMERNQQRDEELNALREVMRQDKLNSPESQAERMAAAGQNAALLGTEGVQEASSMPADNSPLASLQEQMGRSASDIQTIADTALSAVLGVPEFLGSVIDLDAAMTDLDVKKSTKPWRKLGEIFQNYPYIMDFLAGTDPMHLNAADEAEPGTEGLAPSGANNLLSLLGLDKESKDLLGKLRGPLSYADNGVATTGFSKRVNANRKQALSDLTAAAGETVKPGFSESFERMSENLEKLSGTLVDDIYKTTLEYQKRSVEILRKYQSQEYVDQDYSTQLQGLQTQQEMDQFNQEFYNHLDADALSNAQNQEALTRSMEGLRDQYSAEIEKSVDKYFADQLEIVDNSDLSEAEKHKARTAILKKQNEYKSKRLRERVKQITKGSKALGASDWLHSADQAGTAVGNLAGSIIGAL